MITQRLSCLLICLISNACISQSLVVDAAHKDIIVFQFRDKRVNLLNTQDVVQVYKTDTFIIATQRWHPPGREYFNDGLEYLETQYSLFKRLGYYEHQLPMPSRRQYVCPIHTL